MLSTPRKQLKSTITTTPSTPVTPLPRARVTSSQKIPIISSPKTPTQSHRTPVQSPRTPTQSPRNSITPSSRIPVTRSPRTPTPSQKTPVPQSPRTPVSHIWKRPPPSPPAKATGENKRKRSASPNFPFARPTSGVTSPTEYKPAKRVPLSIPCAGTGCDQTDGLKWICKNCSTNLEYGFDDNVYCNCGKATLRSLEFKCTSPQHGQRFMQHDESSLTTLTSKLFQQHLNILILGEMGAGKSTLINAIINGLTYNCLKEAELLGKTQSLIPVKFTARDETLKEVEVNCGSGDDQNEIQSEGQSTTQSSRIYQIKNGNTLIRLIDTPGFGDDRGAEEDVKKFENIKSTIWHLNEIHAIFILLKPNSTKVSPTFNFCVKELLSQFHKAASNNIIFCFSNTRGTLYQPGTALSELEALLKEYNEPGFNISPKNVFCFDNEAERFLACAKNDFLFTEDVHANFSQTWGKSTGDIKMRLEHVQELQPHPIPETLKYEQAYNLVAKMTRPIPESIRMLLTNKAIAEDEIRRIESTAETLEALTKIQMSTSIGVTITKFAHPKTVCSNEKCVTIVEQNNIKTTEYNTVCHSLCKLKGVAADSVGDPRLKKCVAFVDGVCKRKKCGHPLEEHLHIYYDSKQVAQHVLANYPKDGTTAADFKKSMIEERIGRIKALDNELGLLVRASPRISYFLGGKEDGIEMQMRHLVQEERIKVKSGGNRVILDSLKMSLKSYLRKKKALESRIDEGKCDAPNATDMHNLAKELINLEHSGKVLRDSLQCFNYDAKTVFSDNVVVHSKQELISELDVAAEE